MNYLLSILLVYCLFLSPAAAREKVVPIGKFSEKSLKGWQKKAFQRETQYSFFEDEQKGWVVKAESRGSASGLLREISVDIEETPYLNWSWKVDVLPKVKDEKTKEGDDYTARVYVIFTDGFWFWNTKALNYVWNSHYPIGESWPNAFTSNAQVLAVQSGMTNAGEWVVEKRNIQQDILDCFGVKIETIEAIAIMTDSDNSDSRAVAFYGDIFFSSE